MKKLFLILAFVLASAMGAVAQQVVLLHTNDTHSHIDADKGVGGVLQRKAMIDSIRRAEKNVILIDAGDIVQGSLYFKLFGGKVEYPLMDMLGYDVQILGNHEFDNGLDQLARFYKRGVAVKLAANYDFTGTPLEGVFDPYVIRRIGKKKIGIFGLGLDPDGMISADNCRGMKFRDIIATADSTAALLRRKGCDMVVAVTHLGYTNAPRKPLVTDPELAARTRGIDIIIGGHSHEQVSPATAADRPNVVSNADGKPVLIAQTGRYGERLGYIRIDLSGASPTVREAALLPVAGVSPARFDRKIQSFLAPYTHIVDSINRRVIAVSAVDMPNTKQYATSVLFSNFTADAAAAYATWQLDSLAAPGLPRRVDLAVMNSGGIRLPMRKGAVTEGQVLSTYPFTNHLVITRVSGERLDSILRQAAFWGNQGVSSQAEITLAPDGRETAGILIDGRPIDPRRDYYVATLDYLALGGDYMEAFAGSEVVWRDPLEWCAPMMRLIVDMGHASAPIDPDPRPRFRPGAPTPSEP